MHVQAQIAAAGGGGFVIGAVVGAAVWAFWPSIYENCMAGDYARFSGRLPPSSLSTFCGCVETLPYPDGNMNMKAFRCQTLEQGRLAVQ